MAIGARARWWRRELDRTSLAALDATLAAHVGDGLPGLVTLVARGADVHVTVAGARDFGGPPMQRDTIFRIASMTKPVAAAAAMILVEDGRVALDEPVGRLLPEFAAPRVLERLDGPIDETVPAERPIRVEELMTMMLGIGAIMAPGDFPINAAMAARGIGVGPREPDVPGMDAYAAALGSLPLMRQPGEYWLYDTGMQLLGVLIERAAGQPLADFMAERIFAPLGMVDTGFSRAGRQARPAGGDLVAQLRDRRLRAVRRGRRRQPLRVAAGLRLGLGRPRLDGRRLSRLRADDARTAASSGAGGFSRASRWRG